MFFSPNLVERHNYVAIVICVAFVAAAFLLLACQKFKKRSGLSFVLLIYNSFLEIIIGFESFAYLPLAAPESRRRPELMLNRMEPVTTKNESPYTFKPNEFPLFEFQVLAKATDHFFLTETSWDKAGLVLFAR